MPKKYSKKLNFANNIVQNKQNLFYFKHSLDRTNKFDLTKLDLTTMQESVVNTFTVDSTKPMMWVQFNQRIMGNDDRDETTPPVPQKEYFMDNEQAFLNQYLISVMSFEKELDKTYALKVSIRALKSPSLELAVRVHDTVHKFVMLKITKKESDENPKIPVFDQGDYLFTLVGGRLNRAQFKCFEIVDD